MWTQSEEEIPLEPPAWHFFLLLLAGWLWVRKMNVSAVSVPLHASAWLKHIVANLRDFQPTSIGAARNSKAEIMH